MPEPDMIVIASKGLDIAAVKAAESLAAHLLAKSRLRAAPPQWRFVFEFGKPLRQMSVECVEYLQQRGHQVVEPEVRDRALAVVRIVDKPPVSVVDEGEPSAGAGLPHELRAAESAGGAWAIWPLRVWEETLLPPLFLGKRELHAAFAGEIWVPTPRKFVSPFLVAAEAVKAMSKGLSGAQPVLRASSQDARDHDWRVFEIRLEAPLASSPHRSQVDPVCIAQRVASALFEVDEMLRQFAIHSARSVLAGVWKILCDARPRYGMYREDSDARWAFDRWEWIELWGTGENYKQYRCRIPLLVDARPLDVAVHLALTGQVESEMPLRIARKVLDPSFVFGEVPMRDLRNLGQPTNGLPALSDGPVALPDLFAVARADDLVGGGGPKRTQARESPHELTVQVGRAERQTLAGWCPRGAAVRSWLGDRTPQAGWSPTRAGGTSGPLVRDGDRLVWLSFEEPPEDLSRAYPGLVRLVHLAPNVVECLRHWRAKGRVLTDFAARAASWQAAMPASDPLVLRLAEAIFAAVAPWPDPYHVREAEDAARSWSRSQCVERLRTYLEQIAAAPLDQEPPNLIATFLYLIEDKRLICHAWPGELVDEWHFKLRTQDHTWISGSLLVAPADGGRPNASAANEPLRIVGGSHGYLLRCGSLACAIEERDRNNPVGSRSW